MPKGCKKAHFFSSFNLTVSILLYGNAENADNYWLIDKNEVNLQSQ
jgi:hypothetical protein